MPDMDLDHWRKAFLASRRGRRDGDPLYAYRMQADEFECLERLLQSALRVHAPQIALDRCATQGPFQACFVLYAAEWWKRRYAGGSWAWMPILESLGATWESWSTDTRSNCVQRGLRHWGLPLLERAGLRYLGSVAAQGGIPLRLLQEASGQLGSILQRLVQLGAKGNPTEADWLIWIESLAYKLPRHYRQLEIYAILGGVVQTTLDLAQGMGHEHRADPLAWLDRQAAGWRQRFPVEIEDRIVRSLIEGLFREAITERQSKPRRSHVATRYLVEGAQPGAFCLHVDAGFPARVEIADVAALFGLAVDEMPRAATLLYSAGEQNTRLSIRRFPGHAAYRMDAQVLEATGRDAAQAQMLSIATDLAVLKRCVIPQGERLEDDQPWVFDAQVDSMSRLPLLRQGAGRFAPIEVLACVPAGTKVEHVPGSQWSKVGTADLGDRIVFRIRGRVTFLIGTERFAITTQQVDATADAFEWTGSRVWNAFDVPVFTGKPDLYRRPTGDGPRQMRPETLAWKLLGTNALVDAPVGPVEARWPARGDVEWRSRLVVLPANASLRREAGDSANEGTVVLTNWRARRTVSRMEGIEMHCTEPTANSLAIEVKWTKVGEPAPEEIAVDFQWVHTTVTTPGYIPFPGRGVALRGAGGAPLTSGDRAAIHDLYGVRFLVYDARATLTLSLGGVGSSRASARRFELSADAEGRRMEIRPIDYREAIEELLAGGSLDGHVEFSVTTPSGAIAMLRVSRFASALKPNEDFIVGVHAQTTLLALRLNEFGGAPAVLRRHDEEEGAARWHFETDLRAPGPWLVYDAPECAARHRPVLRTVFRDAPRESGQLAVAIGSNEDRRPVALREALAAMAADGAHPDWKLAADLAKLLGHLPLFTLDLWSRFAANPQAIAALALRREFSDAFLRKWSVHLPFLWELVPLSAWCAAAGAVRARMKEVGCDDAVIATHFKWREDALSDHCESIRPLLNKALEAPIEGRVVRKRDNSAADRHFHAALFEVDDCPLHKLMRSHLHDDWPRGLYQELRQAVEQWPGLQALLPPPRRDFHDNAVWLPIVLAYAAVRDQRPAWFGDRAAILAMRAYRRLDPEWFEMAFLTTCQRLLFQ